MSQIRDQKDQVWENSVSSYFNFIILNHTPFCIQPQVTWLDFNATIALQSCS